MSNPELLLKSTPSTRRAVTILLSHMVEYYFGNAGLSPAVFADRELASKIHKENEFLFFDYKRADLLAIIPNFQYAGLIRAKVISADLSKDLGEEVGQAWELTPAGEELLLAADYIPDYIKEAINKRRSEEDLRLSRTPAVSSVSSLYRNAKDKHINPATDQPACLLCKKMEGQGMDCPSCQEWRATNAAPEQTD